MHVLFPRAGQLPPQIQNVAALKAATFRPDAVRLIATTSGPDLLNGNEFNRNITIGNKQQKGSSVPYWASERRCRRPTFLPCFSRNPAFVHGVAKKGRPIGKAAQSAECSLYDETASFERQLHCGVPERAPSSSDRASSLRSAVVYRFASETVAAEMPSKRFWRMRWRVDELRQVATNCRYLASNCITEQARQPLNDVANELDFEADGLERRAGRNRSTLIR